MSTTKVVDMPNAPLSLSKEFVQALEAEQSSNTVDLTLKGMSYLGPGTKTLSTLLNSKPVSGVDLIALKHDLNYGMAKDPLDIAKADLTAIYENATTMPVSFKDLVYKPIMTVGLGLKSLFWNFHPVNIWSSMLSKEKGPYPEKDELERVVKLKGMNVKF